MKKANLHEAKTNLSKLVDLACTGEEVIICKAGVPVVTLVPYKKPIAPRKPGLLKGKISMADDFDELPPEIMEYFK